MAKISELPREEQEKLRAKWREDKKKSRLSLKKDQTAPAKEKPDRKAIPNRGKRYETKEEANEARKQWKKDFRKKKAAEKQNRSKILASKIKHYQKKKKEKSEAFFKSFEEKYG